MISTTFYVASRLAITSLISVSFFEETVLRPIRSGPRKVSAGLVVSALKSTIILILAADEAASMYLSNDTSAPSTDGHIHDAVPAAPRLLGTVCPACELHQGTPDCHPPVNSVTPVPVPNVFFPFHSSSSLSSPVFGSTTPHDITILDLPFITNCKRLSITSDTTTVACDDDRFKDVLLPSQLYSSSPVLESTPCDSDNTTTLDLPNLALCNRLSITSDTALVASDDDSKDVYSDKNTYTTPHPEVRAPAHTTTDDCVDVSTPSTTTIDITSPFCTPYVWPLVVLVDKCQITPTSITNYSIPGSAHLMDALLQATMTTVHSSPSVALNCDFIHLEGIFTGTDEASDTKIVEHHIDTLSPRTPALATDNALVIENSLSIKNVLTIENALTIQHARSHPLNLRSLALLNSFPMSLSANTDANPSGSTHPANVLAHPTKTTPSWLKPLILVTKYATGQLIPLPPTALPCQPEKLRPFKLKQQKRKSMAARMNANRIVGHLAQVCENIRVDKADFTDAWVTAMAEVGLTSILASNHQTSPGSTLPPTFDTPSIVEPGSRIKARLASLRHRTNAVVPTIPATTFPLSPPRPRTY